MERDFGRPRVEANPDVRERLGSGAAIRTESGPLGASAPCSPAVSPVATPKQGNLSRLRLGSSEARLGHDLDKTPPKLGAPGTKERLGTSAYGRIQSRKLDGEDGEVCFRKPLEKWALPPNLKADSVREQQRTRLCSTPARTNIIAEGVLHRDVEAFSELSIQEANSRSRLRLNSAPWRRRPNLSSQRESALYSPVSCSEFSPEERWGTCKEDSVALARNVEKVVDLEEDVSKKNRNPNLARALFFVAVRSALIGILLGSSLSYLQPQSSDCTSTFEKLEDMEYSPPESNSCSSARIFARTHLTGPNVLTIIAKDLAQCCLFCASHEECVAASFVQLNFSCVIFLNVVYEAVQFSWSSSLVLMQGIQITGDTIEGIALKPRKVLESNWWDVFRTYELSNTHPQFFAIEAEYTDKSGKRKFREDYSKTMADILRGFGLRRVHPRKTTRWGFLWALQWKKVEQFHQASLEDWQQINMLPGAAKVVLGDKDALHRTKREAEELYGSSNFGLQSFLLPAEFEKFKSYIESERGRSSIWAWKELSSWSGDGVKILVASEVVAHAMNIDVPVLIQRYVEHPLTLHGHKFDTRWWVVVTSLYPLRVYAVKDCFIRVSKNRYSLEETKLDDKCIHITNGKVQSECDKQQTATYRRSSTPFPTCISDRSFASMLSDSTGHRFRMDSDVLHNQLVRTTFSVLLESILISLPQLRRLRSATKARCFQLLAFDVLYEQDMTPRVLEVNTNGFLGGGILSVARNWGEGNEDDKILRDLVSLVGTKGYDRSPYQEKLEEVVSHFYSQRNAPLNNTVVLAVQETIDELFNSGTWKMIYPFPFRNHDSHVSRLSSVFDGHRDAEFVDLCLAVTHAISSLAFVNTPFP